ncbi:MAG: radical SAM protein [Lachnospiraceae bacterium]|nr:radical SAM protein [Lachnospiraceae bacterium]
MYVEDDCAGYAATTEHILSHFPDATLIPIHHYKDVFNRKNQNATVQRNSRQLILAVCKETWIYPGAPVCQDFGNDNFYYASLMMNCIFDCEYCYLQGMYPSGHLVVFVNIEDCFASLDSLLKEHPVYLCISFDSDLMAFENVTGYIGKWIEYCTSHPDLTVEVRTKSANFGAISHLAAPPNLILAWTLTPDYVTHNFEHKVPGLDARISAACLAIQHGYKVRLCFDPILHFPDFKSVYSDFFKYVFDHISPHSIKDVSFGEFRVSCDYIKKMRKLRPASLVLQYPYDTSTGVATYDADLSKTLTDYIYQEISLYVPSDKIYIWKGDNTND